MVEEQSNPFKVPGYDPVGFLGAGGFGQVFLMREISKLGMPRAVKVLNVHPFNDAKYAEERFEREAKSIAKLKHTSIVGYVASGFTDDPSHFPYIVMEYVKGNNKLTEFMSTLQFLERARLFTRVLDAMRYAHEQDVLHRDIKPSNIIVRESDMNPVLVDFGLAYLFEDENTKALTLSSIGTPGYIPQEVILNPRDRKVTHDIYSCGILLYQILCGRLPDIQNYTDVSQSTSELAGLDRIVRKAIAPVKERYQTMSDFKTGVEGWTKLAEARENLSIIKTDFRDTLLAKKKENDERLKKEALNQRRILDALQEAHRLVYVASEAAFQQVSTTLKEIYEHYELITNSSSDFPNMDNSTKPLFTIEFKKPNFDSRLTIYAVPFVKPREQSKPPIHFDWTKSSRTKEKIRYLPLAWVISQEGNSQSPKSYPVATIAPVVDNDRPEEQIEYTLYGQASAHVMLIKEPRQLRTGTEIQAFIVEILEKRFVGN